MLNLDEVGPFFKNVSEIEREDIQKLIENHVAEGWKKVENPMLMKLLV